MNILTIIPARGGSKGLPGKNIRPLNGIPLIQYPVKTALECKYINRVITTTDSEDIARLAREAGSEVIMRPPELATDDSLVIHSIWHVIDTVISQGYTPDIIVLLEPTSPLRAVKDIEAGIEKVMSGKYDCATALSALKTPPARIWRIVNDETIESFIPESKPYLPRQELETGYEFTGLFYVFTLALISEDRSNPLLMRKRVAAVVVDKRTFVDIDDEVDFRFAELLAGVWSKSNK